MKPLFLLPLFAIAACAPMSTGSLPPPSEITEHTVLDEKAGLSVELAYQAANLAARTANRAGVLSPSTKARLADLDTAAYNAVLNARMAYDLGNSQSYAEATVKAQGIIRQILALIK